MAHTLPTSLRLCPLSRSQFPSSVQQGLTEGRVPELTAQAQSFLVTYPGMDSSGWGGGGMSDPCPSTLPLLRYGLPASPTFCEAWSSVELSDSQLLWPKGSSAPGHRGVYPERTFSIPQQMGTASLAALRRPCHPLQMGPAVDVITAC